jgi:hypothetical protein
MAETEQSLSHLLHNIDLREPPASAGAAGALLDVLPYLGRALGLQDLACLAATCQQLKQGCMKFIHHNARVLLLDALPPVQTVDCFKAAAEAAAADRRLQPVLWLLHVARQSASTALAAADVLQRLVHLPYVPLQHAKQLVAAGVRISYAQPVAGCCQQLATWWQDWMCGCRPKSSWASLLTYQLLLWLSAVDETG